MGKEPADFCENPVMDAHDARLVFCTCPDTSTAQSLASDCAVEVSGQVQKTRRASWASITGFSQKSAGSFPTLLLVI